MPPPADDARIEPDVQIHNCHVHVFTNDSVPNGFFPLGLLRLLRMKGPGSAVSDLLRSLKRREEEDRFDRLAAFADIGNLKSQRDVFLFLKGFYPPSTRFVLLAMDMEFMGAGRVPKPYEEQLDELAALKDEFPENVVPFVAADPRRPGVVELVRRRLEQGFGGIKLYPPLGYYPCDERLFPLYEYAEERGIPVLAHCSRGGVYYRGKITPEMRVNPCRKVRHDPAGNRDFASRFTDPRNYAAVLRRFTELKLCLAHFGGGVEWDDYLAIPRVGDEPRAVDAHGRVIQTGEDVNWLSYIKNNLFQFPNVYADVSFVMHVQRFIPVLKVLLEQDAKVRERTLFGTDYYMVARQRSERAFSFYVRAELGETLFRQIAETNPRRFLARKA